MADEHQDVDGVIDAAQELLDDDPERRWWVECEIATGVPPLVIAADYALAVTLEAERLRMTRATETGEVTVPLPRVLLVALALVQAVRQRPADERDTWSWLNLAENVQLGRAHELLRVDATARAVAALRPPAGRYASSEQAARATRPDTEWGTVPAAVAAELDRLLDADPTGPDGWYALRQQVLDALALYREQHRDEIGGVYSAMRQWRVRRFWLDQHPDRPPIVPAGEPGTY